MWLEETSEMHRQARAWDEIRDEDATLSTQSALLSIANNGLRLVTRQSQTDQEGSWTVESDELLIVHGWHLETSRQWIGAFQMSTSEENEITIDGLGPCRALTLCGTIIGNGAPSLNAELVFAFVEGSDSLVWRADIHGASMATELDTITMLKGRASNQGTERLAPQWRQRQEDVCWFLGGCLCCCNGWLFFTLSLMSLLTSTVAGVLALRWMCDVGRAWRKKWVWWTVLVNGWQSFSYAGFISLEWCYGVTSWARMLASYLGVWRLQPVPQTGWAFSGAFHDGGRMPPRRLFGSESSLLGFLGPSLHRQSTALASDMFAVITAMHPRGASRRTALLSGFLGQREQFGLVSMDPWAQRLALHASCDGARLNPGGRMQTDWAVLKWSAADDQEPALEAMEWFTAAVGKTCRARVPAAGDSAGVIVPVVPTGWCSWYEHMDKVSEEIIGDNVTVMRDMRAEGPRLQVMQLDDGYAPCWGDWELPKASFPHGLQGVAKTAADSGLQPGLWIAAWTADKESQVARQHPDWVIRRKVGGWMGLSRGGAANSGFTHPGKFFYGLDATHPACREHVTALIRRVVRDYGFKFLKVDFLHAAALPGRRFDPTATRAQALQIALAAVREGAGDAFVLGCSCPLGAAVGLVDAMRVSADTAPHWTAFPIPWDKTNLPSGRNMVRNSLVRQAMHRRWWLNNPDCVVLRHLGTERTERRKAEGGLSVAALTGGLLFLSDDLATLGTNSQNLALARTLTPPVLMGGRAAGLVSGESPEILVEHLDGPEGSWALVGMFNWTGGVDGRAVPLTTVGGGPGPGEVVVCLEFWEQTVSMGWAGTLQARDVGARSAKVLAVRRRAMDAAAYLGSSLHISCGKELARWEETEGRVDMHLRFEASGQGHVSVYLPACRQTPPRAQGAAFTGGEILPLCKQGGQPMDGAWKVPVAVCAGSVDLSLLF